MVNEQLLHGQLKKQKKNEKETKKRREEKN